MRPINIVLAHHDAVSSESLAASLVKQFRHITTAQSPEEIRSAIARFRAPFAVVDLELVSAAELRELCARFPATAFVCIHRLADDRMWSEALASGAVDCCLAGDIKGILLAADRYIVLSRNAAA